MDDQSNIKKPGSKNTFMRKSETHQLGSIPDFTEWLGDGLIVFDVRMNFIYVNQKGAEILGREPGELVGKGLWDEFPEFKGTDFANTCLQAIKSQEETTLEEFNLFSDCWCQLRFHPSREGLAIYIIDISKQKRVEKALQKSEEKYRHLVETAHDLIWAVDDQGKITFINEAAREIFGYEPEELTGRSYLELLPPEERERQLQSNERFPLLDQEFTSGYEIDVLHRSGERRTLLANAVHVLDEHGNVTGAMGTSADITERVKAEASLRESQQRFQSLFENALDAILLADDRMRYVDANPAACKLLGYSRDELLAMSVQDLTPLPDRKRVAEMWQEFILKGKMSGEIQLLCRDGSILTAEFNASANIAPGLHMSIMNDVTDRKQAAADLRYAQKLLEKTFASLTEAIFVIDFEKRNIITCNPAVEHIFGYQPEEIIGRKTEFLHVDHDSYVRFGKVGNSDLSEKGYYHTEYRMRRKDGEVIMTEHTVSALFDDEDRITGAVSVVRDITERKKMEDALRRAETLFRAILNNAPLTIFATDKEGNFMLSDGKGLERIGLKSGQHVGLSVYDLYGSQQLVGEAGEELTGEETVRRALKGETQTTYTEMMGSYYENRVGPLRDKDGDIDGIVGVSIDVTDRVRAEEEIKHQAARAEVLVRTAGRLNQQLDLEAVIQSVCQEALETFGFSQCAIALYDEEQDWLAYAGGVNIPAEVVEKMEPIPRAQFDEIADAMGPLIIVPNVQKVPGLPNAELNARQDIRTVVVSTMMRNQDLIGTLTLGLHGRERSLTLDEQSLLKALSDQAAQAIINAKLLKTANAQRERLRRMSARLMEVQEAERRSLTRELHDRVGQNLTALSISLQTLKDLLPGSAAQALSTKFDDAQELVQDTTRHIRDFMAELHPPELEDYGLAAALETYAERAASLGGLELSTELSDLSRPLPEKQQMAFFRTVQEAINNVLKHAEASRLWISLEESQGRIRLKVEDNGRGFAADPASSKDPQTWGLKIMRERVESVGGVMTVESRLGAGTCLVFEIERQS